MAQNWETFKSTMDTYWDTSCIMYEDEKGNEIPLKSEKEFQEAVKIAKLNKNQLKLIVYDENITRSQKINMDFPEPSRIFNTSESIAEPFKNPQVNAWDSKAKQNNCHCNDNVPPEWFTDYMKKFKNDLLNDLRSDIFEMINYTIEKKQKEIFTKSDSVDFFGEKYDTFSPVITHMKKKKKVLEKDTMDFPDQRDIKQPKKLEKLHSTKSERLEKVDNKTKFLQEEKKKLLERKCHLKSKLEKNIVLEFDKKKFQKSASFYRDCVYLYLTPGEEFTLNVNITNDGKLRWCSPRLECYGSTGLYPHEVSVNLPKLLPGENCFVTLEGKAANFVGVHHFKCRVVEYLEKIGSEFTCWAKVDFFDPVEKRSPGPDGAKAMEVAAVVPGDSDEKLIDFDKDVISNSEKKIEENIIEIERRLHYIDFLRSTSAEAITKKNGFKTKKVFIIKPESQTESCDLLRSSEEEEKNYTKRLEQEEVVFGVDCLQFPSEDNKACEAKNNPQTEENAEKFDNLEKINKYNEVEDSSDSEFSVIIMSEENDNFTVVPLSSRSSSSPESIQEDKNSEVNTATNEVIQADIVIENIIETEEKLDKEPNISENLSTNQMSPTRSRRSPFREDISKSKPKKMKSRSTEYHFTTAELTQPTFTPGPDIFYVRPKFTFSGEKKEKKSPEDVFEFTHNAGQEAKSQVNDFRRKNLLVTDTSGRIIYAVNSRGLCIPVGDLFKN